LESPQKVEDKLPVEGFKEEDEMSEEKAMKNAKKDGEKKEKKGKVNAAANIIEYAEAYLEDEEHDVPKRLKKTKTTEPVEYVQGIASLTGKMVNVDIEDVKALSRTIYVENIHAKTPNILAVVYRAIGVFHYVTLRISEEEFLRLEAHPRFKNKVHYTYVDDFLVNDPNTGLFRERSYAFDFPQWPTPEQIREQTKKIISHYGIPNLSAIEAKLFPTFNKTRVKQDLGPAVVEEIEETEEPVAKE
jgi:hypothetical protein